MSDIGEKTISPDGVVKQLKLVKCEWDQCRTRHEVKKPNYPKNGKVDKSSDYKEKWEKEGLQPWDLYGPGTDSKATPMDYQADTPNPTMLQKAIATKPPEYVTEAHHVIPVNLIKNYKAIGNNAKLIGYDINHKNNGMCLPYYTLDIVQHDLQCHRSGHPIEYNVKLSDLLAELEIACQGYCLNDTKSEITDQKKLIENLNAISERARKKINSWEWLIRKNAIQERDLSKSRVGGV